MIEFLGRLRRGVDVERQLLQLLANNRLVVAARFCDSRRDWRADLESEAPANLRDHPLGLGSLGRISGKGGALAATFQQA